MSLTGLVYASRATVAFDDEGLHALSARSAAANAQAGITGYLYFQGGRFLQYLEGEHAEVMALLEVIARDDRHRIHRVVADRSLEARRFPTWHMKWLRAQHLAHVGLEQILYDFMHLKHSPLLAEDPTPPHMWRLVDRIADTQNRLRFAASPARLQNNRRTHG